MDPVIKHNASRRGQLIGTDLGDSGARFADPFFQHHVTDFQEIHIVDGGDFLHHCMYVCSEVNA